MEPGSTSDITSTFFSDVFSTDVSTVCFTADNVSFTDACIGGLLLSDGDATATLSSALISTFDLATEDCGELSLSSVSFASGESFLLTSSSLSLTVSLSTTGTVIVDVVEAAVVVFGTSFSVIFD